MEKVMKIYEVPVELELRTSLLVTATSKEEAYERYLKMSSEFIIESAGVKLHDLEVDLEVYKDGTILEELEERYPADLFREGFYRTEKGLYEIYYNPDSSSGGQIVIDLLCESFFDELFGNICEKIVKGESIDKLASECISLLRKEAIRAVEDLAQDDFGIALAGINDYYVFLFPNDAYDDVQKMFKLYTEYQSFHNKVDF